MTSITPGITHREPNKAVAKGMFNSKVTIGKSRTEFPVGVHAVVRRSRSFLFKLRFKFLIFPWHIPITHNSG